MYATCAHADERYLFLGLHIAFNPVIYELTTFMSVWYLSMPYTLTNKTKLTNIVSDDMEVITDFTAVLCSLLSANIW